MKIAIIGNAGSGKSTLALRLHKILTIPLYHLDQYFWKPGWQESDRAEFATIHQELCDRPSWIIEGMGIRFLEYRLQKADVVIFLDMPTYRCLYRVFKRAYNHFGKEHGLSAKGCPEQGPSLKFLKFVLRFNRDRKPVIERLLATYKNQKKIYWVKNKAELELLIHNIQEGTL